MRTETDLELALDHLGSQSPDAVDFLAEFRHRRQRGRIRHRLAVGAVAAVGAAVIVMAGVLGFGQKSVQDTQPVQFPDASPSATDSTDWPTNSGGLSRVPRILPPNGWQIDLLTTSEFSDGTRLRSIADPEGQGCEVTFYTSDGDKPFAGHPKITLAGRVGLLSPSERGSSTEFWYSYRPGAWASVSCIGMDNPVAMITSILRGFQDDRQTLRMPFTLGILPSQFAVLDGHQLVIPGVGSGVDVFEKRNGAGLHSVEISLVDAIPKLPGATTETISLGDRSAVLGIGQPYEGKAWLCLSPRKGSTATICGVNLASSDVEPDAQAVVRERLITIMSRVQPTADFADQQSWPRAPRIIPR